MNILTQDIIEFLNQEEFHARRIIVVAKKIQEQKGGASHGRSRAIGKGDAYCYEDVQVFPK